MNKNYLLTAPQIQQLRQAVTKIIQANMIGYATKVSSNCQFQSQNDLEMLYTFSEREYTRLQSDLQRIAQFTFQIMSNVEMIWEEVHHREQKIVQLRQSFSSATDYMEELKMENDQIRSKLTEAETYIECIQEEKQFLDALYYQRDRSSLFIPHESGRNLSRCVSERSLNWEENHQKKKRNFSYEKLKQYINTIKQQRQQLETQLLGLTKQYELKCQECKKANFFIEHLVQRLNKKSQLKQYIESLNNYTNEMKEYNRNELNSDDFFKILEKTQKTQNSAIQARRNFVALNEQYDLRNFIPCIDQFSNITQTHKQCFSQNNLSFISKNNINHTATHDVMVCTEKIIKKSAFSQTQSFQQTLQLQSTKNKPDYKIQIQIYGKQKDKQMQIQKIIKGLNIQKSIESKLTDGRLGNEKERQKYQQRHKQLKQKDTYRQRQRLGQLQGGQNKQQKINNKWMSTFEYYQKKIISSRIKKYHYEKPHLNLLKFIKKN